MAQVTFKKEVELRSASAEVKDSSGRLVQSIELNPEIFGRPLNVHLMHQVVVAQLAGARSGTQSTKTRAEVSGGGAKPFRQKGTGRARQGSTRAPHYSGGGVALGPKPRSYQQKTPRKMIQQALFCALSDRAEANRIVVIEDPKWEKPSTKAAKALLKNCAFDGNVLLVVEPEDENLILSFRNVPEVVLAFPWHLIAYSVLVSDYIVFTRSALIGEEIDDSPRLLSVSAAASSSDEEAE